MSFYHAKALLNKIVTSGYFQKVRENEASEALTLKFESAVAGVPEVTFDLLNFLNARTNGHVLTGFGSDPTQRQAPKVELIFEEKFLTYVSC